MNLRNNTLLASLLLAVAVPLTSQTEQNRLAEIRTELELVRAEAPQHADTRGASSRLTKVKHLLRDWIEPQLTSLPSNPNGEDGGELTLADRLNAELEREHLFLETKPGEDVDGWKMIGFLGPIRLQYGRRQTYLVVQTGIVVNCGLDESAYLYRWRDGHWVRVWETEQNAYTKDGYLVQNIRAVLVSPPFTGLAPHVMTLGTEPWCSSNWHNVYVRLWHVSAAGIQPKLLLDHTEWAYLDGHDIPIMGSLGREDALVEYRVGDVGPGDTRERVLHFSIKQDRVERIHPIALGPRDFVSEWLSLPWKESVRWSEKSRVTALRRAHADRGRDLFQSTQRCTTPNLWQVGLGSLEGDKEPMYYVVRWDPPY